MSTEPFLVEQEVSGEERAFLLTIPSNAGKERADKAIARFWTEASRSRIQKLFEAGRVWKDDESLSKSDRVGPGDVLTFTIPPDRPLELCPVEIPLKILFEDEDLLVLDKASGMVVHPGAGTGDDTLVHALLHHCKGQLSGIGGVERPGIVHRLDKETSGVMVVAKSDQAFQGLSRQFANRQTHKVYLAWVEGVPEDKVKTMEGPIGRHPVHRMKMCIRKDGRPAWSQSRLLRSEGRRSLLEVEIRTGRTHQIRVHLSAEGYPIIGDRLYGWKGDSGQRILLHARSLEFCHPATGEWRRFAADWDEE